MGDNDGSGRGVADWPWQRIGSIAAPIIMLAAAWWADPCRNVAECDAAPVDRIFIWSFAIFSAGLALLFILFVGLTITGTINLPKAFQDKSATTFDSDVVPDLDAQAGSSAPTKESKAVSLSRLQAFMWTLVIMTVYFHEAITYAGEGLPRLPSELLMVMGISSAVYLASKQMSKG